MHAIALPMALIARAAAQARVNVSTGRERFVHRDGGRTGYVAGVTDFPSRSQSRATRSGMTTLRAWGRELSFQEANRNA
jgi:hypothetical protein